MSIYHSQDDPWDNGWANTESPSSTANLHQSTAHIGSSSYLTSSQLLGSPHSGTPLGESSGGSNAVSNSSSKVSLQNIPSSYKHVYEKIGESCSTTNELEVLVFNKLIAGNEFTQYQKSRIIDVMYDNNLLPPSREANFYQILGLIALELDVPGTGDYVTLQFRFQTLPELSDKVVKSLLGSSDSRAGVASDYSNAPSIASIDPLNAHLANTSITEDEQDDPLNRHRVGALIDPILTDHSSIQHRQEGASSADVHQHGGSSEGAPITFDEITKYVDGIKDTFKVLCGNTKDIVRIKEVPEKEGLLFKHTNYIISHELNLGLQSPAGGKKVIRRYSDFVWLLEYLLRKYPFRVIPGLPPKKFNGSSPDSQFLQKRRRGLHRFLNQLVRHPVLVEDSLVVTFLSVPTDLATWKKQAKIDYSLEFKGLKILTQFINSIWPSIGEEFLTDWKQSENNITKLIEIWTKIVLLVERYEKRQQQISLDNGKFVEMINKFLNLNGIVYPHNDDVTVNLGFGNVISSGNKDDVSSINESLNSILDYFNKSSQLLIDESFIINTTVLEKFKNYLDYLYSLQELFERLKKLLINNIPQLQSRIQENEKKYSKLLNDDVDIKGSELAKLRQIIINDKQEIFQQLNKDWLIKECCFKEFIMFQETQYLISDLWIDWSKGRFKFQEKVSVLHETLNKEVIGNMPTK